jgi:Leucine-rich repeat (LRR) protein
MLNQKEIDNLYQLLLSRSNTESISIALEIISSNQAAVDLKIYPQLIEIAQEIEIDDQLTLSDLREADLIQQILHVNNAKAISIDKKEYLELLQYHKHFNELHTIHCWSLKLDSIPKEIHHYQNLNYLNLGNNKIKVVSEWLKELPLKRLNLFSNLLKEIPVFLLEMPELEEIQLGANFISEIPEEIEKMKQLKYLGLTDNQIKIIPESLYQLKDLEVLSLTGNPLSKKDVEQLKIALPQTSIYFA